MKPIYLIPEFKEKIWSGNYLDDDIGESWCLTVRNDTVNKIKGSSLNLMKLFLDNSVNKDIFGRNFLKGERFPLLLKYLSVSSKLSVQVHPNDEYAKRYNDYGKMEVWYVIDCEDDAFITYGLKDVDSRGHLLEILQDNDIQSYFNIVKVKKGDIIPIYPGTIHAIMGNIFIFEIQQNSDLTFRLYDWNRQGNDRPLHIKESFDVIDLHVKKLNKSHGEFHSDKFSFKKHSINSAARFYSRKDSCIILNVLKGEGKLVIDSDSYDLKYLNTVLIPACIQEFVVTGNVELIESWI